MITFFKKLDILEVLKVNIFSTFVKFVKKCCWYMIKVSSAITLEFTNKCLRYILPFLIRFSVVFPKACIIFGRSEK